ncbi:MAG: hypothetical protein DMF81_14390 [Acidobacteria bacterium]|nr:MAG: hypothetical protein DMF81_14390 [Acidobacteriota bacterium]
MVKALSAVRERSEPITPRAVPRGARHASFFIAVSLTCASTLMYEVVLTRLLSVVSWYYLAFVSVSIGMFGMTAGALVVQLRSDLFPPVAVPHRMSQAGLAMAVSLPATLLTMLAVPIEVSLSVQTLYSFVLFSAVISVPFFFSGIAVCLSLTRTALPVGLVYFADLLGAAAGCVCAIALLKVLDGPSAVLAIGALALLGAAAYAVHAGESSRGKRLVAGAVALAVLAVLNASTLYGVQPIWVKGRIDRRTQILAEVWNPISKVRAWQPTVGTPLMWGPSSRMPRVELESINLDIDNDAATPLMRFRGEMGEFAFLGYDVTSLATRLRRGGSAAIIGFGGGRDALTAALYGFRRIVGIEVNDAVAGLSTRRLDWFSGLSRLPGLEVHVDEGRSWLTRSGETFDVIQASMVDTWAATSAGALSLSENALYTVDAWRVFYRHLRPGGLLTFTRWNTGPEVSQTHRMFSVAWATLLSEGVEEPGRHLALVSGGPVATLLLSNRPLDPGDLQALQGIAREMDFRIEFLPGQAPVTPELRQIAAARTLDDLARLRSAGLLDYSPVYDASPFFFNSVHLRKLPELVRTTHPGGNLRALVFVLCFMVAAVILLVATVLLPLGRGVRLRVSGGGVVGGGIAYFIAIGVAFMLVEIGLMQQLSIFLGHPIYSLVLVLAVLIFSTGLGSLASERLEVASALAARAPALLAAPLIALCAGLVVPLTHRFTAAALPERALVSMMVVAPCGLIMGFCFPVGLRWMTGLGQHGNLPWMWALNGAASVVAGFLALLISMEVSITACLLTGAFLYLLAALAVPRPKKGEDGATAA